MSVMDASSYESVVKLLRTAVLCGITVTSYACRGISSPSTNQNKEFPGTLRVGGTSTHEFQVSKNGEYEVRIISLSPVQTAIIGVGFGQLVGGGCALSNANPSATLNRLALAGVIFPGTWCVQVFDSVLNPLVQDLTYTVRVSYP
jgi:hypothetical protein